MKIYFALFVLAIFVVNVRSDSYRIFRETNSNGAPVDDNKNSLTAGRYGPILLSDFTLIDKLSSINGERIPERVVHAQGAGAHGYFVVTNDITKYIHSSFHFAYNTLDTARLISSLELAKRLQYSFDSLPSPMKPVQQKQSEIFEALLLNSTLKKATGIS